MANPKLYCFFLALFAASLPPPAHNKCEPPLLSCVIMRSLHKMITLHSTVNVRTKQTRHCDSLLSLGRALIVLLLMISGNVHVHPGPSIVCSPSSDLCPDVNLCHNDLSVPDFCSRKALGFLHVNARSLLPKIDQIKVLVHSSNPEVLVITESWLKKNIPDSDIGIAGYNVFRQDRSSKAGGVVIFTKEHLQCSIATSKSVPKQFDLLIVNIKLANSSTLTVAG